MFQSSGGFTRLNLPRTGCLVSMWKHLRTLVSALLPPQGYQTAYAGTKQALSAGKRAKPTLSSIALAVLLRILLV